MDGGEHIALIWRAARGCGRPAARCSCACTASASPATCSAACAATAAASWRRRCAAWPRGEGVVLYAAAGPRHRPANKRRPPAADPGPDTVEASKALGLPVDVRDHGADPARPRRAAHAAADQQPSSTTPSATACRSRSGCRCRSRRTATTRITSGPSATSWATTWSCRPPVLRRQSPLPAPRVAGNSGRHTGVQAGAARRSA
jgi:hypothetical protein